MKTLKMLSLSLVMLVSAPMFAGEVYVYGIKQTAWRKMFPSEQKLIISQWEQAQTTSGTSAKAAAKKVAAKITSKGGSVLGSVKNFVANHYGKLLGLGAAAYAASVAWRGYKNSNETVSVAQSTLNVATADKNKVTAPLVAGYNRFIAPKATQTPAPEGNSTVKTEQTTTTTQTSATKSVSTQKAADVVGQQVKSGSASQK